MQRSGHISALPFPMQAIPVAISHSSADCSRKLKPLFVVARMVPTSWIGPIERSHDRPWVGNFNSIIMIAHAALIASLTPNSVRRTAAKIGKVLRDGKKIETCGKSLGLCHSSAFIEDHIKDQRSNGRLGGVPLFVVPMSQQRREERE